MDRKYKLVSKVDKYKKYLIILLIIILISLVPLLFVLPNHEKASIKKIFSKEYDLYLNNDSPVKINFEEEYINCYDENKEPYRCSDISYIVRGYQYLSNESKLLFKNLDLKNKDLIEAINLLLESSKEKNISIDNLNIISNFKNSSNLLESKLKEYNVKVFYNENIDEKSLIKDKEYQSIVDNLLLDENILVYEKEVSNDCSGYYFAKNTSDIIDSSLNKGGIYKINNKDVFNNLFSKLELDNDKMNEVVNDLNNLNDIMFADKIDANINQGIKYSYHKLLLSENEKNKTLKTKWNENIKKLDSKINDILKGSLYYSEECSKDNTINYVILDEELCQKYHLNCVR